MARAGGRTGAIAHSFWSTFFQRAPFDMVRDIEYDDAEGPIHHGRFHTMTGYNHQNQMTPSDLYLFATLTMLTERHGILHTCTLDSTGHRYGHDYSQMDQACFAIDAQLAAFLPRWRRNGYEVIVTADHGQTNRGHHGGHDEEMQDFVFYWFGGGEGPSPSTLLGQLQLAPTVLSRLGVRPPESMTLRTFLT